MDRDELERLERQFSGAFADVRYAINHLIAEGDQVVLRMTTHAIHRGDFERVTRTNSW